MSSFNNPCCHLLSFRYTVHGAHPGRLLPGLLGGDLPGMHGRLHRRFSSDLALIDAPKKRGLLCDGDDDAGGSRHLQGGVVGNVIKSEGRRLDAASLPSSRLGLELADTLALLLGASMMSSGSGKVGCWCRC